MNVFQKIAIGYVLFLLVCAGFGGAGWAILWCVDRVRDFKAKRHEPVRMREGLIP